MAPEQSMGKEVDARADIFALGVVFYQMLVGQVPMGKFRLPSEVLRGIPKQTDGIIEGCLESDPNDRYEGLKELSEAINRVVILEEQRSEEQRRREEEQRKIVEQKKREEERKIQEEKNRAEAERIKKKKEEGEKAHEEERKSSFAKKAIIVVLVIIGVLYFISRQRTDYKEAEQIQEPAVPEETTTANKPSLAKRDETVKTPLTVDVTETPKPTPQPKPVEVPDSYGTSGTYTDPITDMKFIFVKGGCFQMGDIFGDGESDEKPVHEVCVDDFYMGKYEVTQGQWKEVMGSNPSHFSNCGNNCPVETVSWNDVQDFIKRLNQKTSANYRLPTEAEWEYSARSGGKEEKYSGGNNIDSVAWYDENSGNRTHPVDQKSPNGLDIYDMTGNVWEWVQDLYDSNYYNNSPRNNPTGANSGVSHVLRGGSWLNLDRDTRAYRRLGRNPGYRRDTLGFRLVRTP
jgi:formylglycine-generating enzyme required for sulfatase activity